MADLFFTFLGTGNYREVEYRWRGLSSKTAYAQAAAVDILQRLGEPPARVYVLLTKEARIKHWQKRRDRSSDGSELIVDGGLKPTFQKLREQAAGRTFELHEIDVDTELSTASQWKTFERIIERCNEGDRITIDMTHGYRSVPVVLSSALHFLRLAKGIQIHRVLYGEFEQHEIIDYVSFYAIQEWTDAVSRVIDEADGRKLAELASRDDGLNLLGDDAREIAEALDTLTNAIRNVEMPFVADRAAAALALIEAARHSTPEGEGSRQVLLDLLLAKFGQLAMTPPGDGTYTGDYLRTQHQLAALLLKHRLFMQAFTVQQELVGSIGMLAIRDDGKKTDYRSAKKDRRLYANLFISMITYDEPRWNFKEEHTKPLEKLKPFYHRHAEALAPVRNIAHDLSNLRNGFDHGWNGRRPPEQSSLQESGAQFQIAIAGAIDAILPA